MIMHLVYRHEHPDYMNMSKQKNEIPLNYRTKKKLTKKNSENLKKNEGVSGRWRKRSLRQQQNLRKFGKSGE